MEVCNGRVQWKCAMEALGQAKQISDDNNQDSGCLRRVWARTDWEGGTSCRGWEIPRADAEGLTGVCLC